MLIFLNTSLWAVGSLRVKPPGNMQNANKNKPKQIFSVPFNNPEERFDDTVMPVGAFPLVKLGFLLIRQISKPIANSIARRAQKSRLFRDYVCIPTAQLFHWYDVKVRMRILNLGKVTHIPKLNEEKAIETGSQLLSELIILGVASGMVVFEYRRQSEKEEAKQQQAEMEKCNLNDKIINLELAIETQNAQIRELTRLAYSLSTENKTEATSEKKEILYDPEEDKNEPPSTGSWQASTPASDPIPPRQSDTDSETRNPGDTGVILQSVNYVLDGCSQR